jgi:nitrate reductase (NAD(P)H)
MNIDSDLNVNSAIAKPNHGDILLVPEINDDSEDSEYAIRGYAYSGGGRRVARVEISLDQGNTWKLAEMYVPSMDVITRRSNVLILHLVYSTYPEDLYRAVCYEDPVYGTLDLTERDTCL